MKTNIKRCFVLLLLTLSLIGWQVAVAQTITYHITHNINDDGDLTISGTDTKNYRITGKNTGAESDTTYNRIRIETGYQGYIMFDGVKMKNHPDSVGTDAKTGYSPITVLGEYNRSNLTPVTDVKIILNGENYLRNTTFYHPALRVDQGAQIRISAIDSLDNNSGKLYAFAYDQTDSGSGSAAIGGGYNTNSYHLSAWTANPPVTPGVPVNPYQQGIALGLVRDGSGVIVDENHQYNNYPRYPSAVGNIIISSGTIVAHGGYHGAGIGSGWYTWLVGNIAIYGGDVTSTGGGHAAGIGTGCPTGSGNAGFYAINSSIIVLPPARITATTRQSAKKGLAGAGSITYIGDPESPLVTVKTEDDEKYADIYADITETESVRLVFDSLDINYDIARIKFGNTGDSANYKFRAVLEQPSIFFTDKSSTYPDHYGRPYKPAEAIIPSSPMNQSIILYLYDINIEMEIYPASANPLTQGYSTTDAREKAYRVKIIYNDPSPLINLGFDLQSGPATQFKAPIFLDKDSMVMTTPPTSFNKGDVYQIVVPLQDGHPVGLYEETLRMTGYWKGVSIGSLRLPIEQRVVYQDIAHNYIKVTADPVQFSIAASDAATRSVALTLNISHPDYNPNDVPYAKYLITESANYYDAIATPLSQWKDLNNSMISGKDSTVLASFAGLDAGRYYIHWFVISGNYFGHSDNAPTIPYGGFGPYVIADVKDDLATVFEYGSIDIDIFANDALPDFFLNTVPSALSLITEQPKAGVLSANGKQLVYKHTNASVLTNNVDSFAYQLTINGKVFNAKGYIYVLSSNSSLAACKNEKYEITLQGSNVTYTWYDIDGNKLSTTGSTHTINSISTDTHLGVAPVRTTAPYKDLQFPTAWIMIKVVNPDGISTMRWTGAIDTCWHNPGNWVEVNGGGVETPTSWIPTSCVNVIIPSGVPNYPMLVKDGECNNIEMQDRAMLAGIHYLTYNAATVEITLKPTDKNRFIMWSAPLKSMYSGDYHYRNSLNVIQRGDVYMNLFQYAHPSGIGSAAANSFTATFGELGESLSLGKAFNVLVTSTTDNYGKSFKFPQTENSYTDTNGKVYGSLSRANGSKFIVDKTQTLSASRTFSMTVVNDVAGSSMVQIVNPYMAYLDVNKFLSNNSVLGSSYAIWNGNVNENFIQYLVGTAGTGNRYHITTIPMESSGLIPPLQSFFVTKNTPSSKIASVTMSPDWTTTVGTTPYTLRSVSDEEAGILRIKATQGANVSYTVLHNDALSSSAYDPEEDMYKLFYDEISLDIYLFTPNKEALAIHSTKDFTQNINLGLRVKNEGMVTLNFDRLTGFGHDTYLIDNELKKEIDLQANPSYSFTVAKTSGNGDFIEINERFSLRFVYNLTSVEDVADNKLLLNAQDGYIHIRSTGIDISQVSVYDVNGALIHKTTTTSDHHRIQVSRQSTYIVKGLVGDKEYTQKIFVD